MTSKKYWEDIAKHKHEHIHMESKTEPDIEYYFNAIKDIVRHGISTDSKSKPNAAITIIVMIEDLKEVIVKYLEIGVHMHAEAMLFSKYLKSISSDILTIGNVALMLIAIISWFNLKGINSVDKDNLVEWLSNRLNIINSEYINSFTKVHNATVMEVMHSYSYTLSKILIHKDFGYGSYKDLYVPMILNRAVAARREHQ